MIEIAKKNAEEAGLGDDHQIETNASSRPEN